jgi:hypothetical protein
MNAEGAGVQSAKFHLLIALETPLVRSRQAEACTLDTCSFSTSFNLPLLNYNLSLASCCSFLRGFNVRRSSPLAKLTLPIANPHALWFPFCAESTYPIHEDTSVCDQK